MTGKNTFSLTPQGIGIAIGTAIATTGGMVTDAPSLMEHVRSRRTEAIDSVGEIPRVRERPDASRGDDPSGEPRGDAGQRRELPLERDVNWDS